MIGAVLLLFVTISESCVYIMDNDMRIITHNSALTDTHSAIADCVKALQQQQAKPSMILCYFTENHDGHLIVSTLLEQFPNSKIHGCSSCKGVMTEAGFTANSAMGIWVLEDNEQGAYGTAISSMQPHNIKQITQSTLRQAISHSGRDGETPSLIVLHATPGFEESIIAFIESELGSEVPLIGGSAADTSMQQKWQIITEQGVLTDGLSISVFYPNCHVSYSFHSGYYATKQSGYVTKSDGRTVLEIDNQPASEVYRHWANIDIDHSQNVMAQSTLSPIGRIATHNYDVANYKLAHPFKFVVEGGIELFATIDEGEKIHLMKGTTDQIITRAGRVIDSAIDTFGDQITPIGGLNIYCAGLMLHVEDNMDTVCHYVNDAMHAAPYICPFTFGEQGSFISGVNAHGNLMISAVLFHHA
jgi:hypothetical protein